METLVFMAGIVLIVLIVQVADVLRTKYRGKEANDEGDPDA